MARKFIVGLIAGCLLGCASATVPIPPRELSPFEQTCAQVEQLVPEATCAGLVPPTVITTQLVRQAHPMWNGVHFMGEDYIFISPTATSRSKTITHETVHYILSNNGIGMNEEFLVTREGICLHEIIARKIAGQVWDHPVILENYGCTAEGEVVRSEENP